MSPTQIAIGLVVALTATASLSSCSASLESASLESASLESAGLESAGPESAISSTTAQAPIAPQASTTAPVVSKREPIVLGFAGDTSFTGGLDQRQPLVQIRELLAAPDLMVVNLETAVADAEVGRPPVQKSFLFKSPPASLDLLVAAGVDVAALGNNHTLDFGPEAVEQTLRELEARDLAHVGGGRNEAEAYKALIVAVEDWTVGLVSVSRVPCDWSASGENVRPQVAWACPPFLDQVDAAVADALEADVTVVMAHGGEEGVFCPSDFMVALEQRWADQGVDAVINGHPHVLQGVGRLGDTWVVHSTGNFAFPSARGVTANSALFSLTVREGQIDLSVTPVRVEAGVGRMPSERERRSIVDQINNVSSNVHIDDAGVATEVPATETGCRSLDTATDQSE